MDRYESMTRKRHEAKLQAVRQEREMETQRLNKLKLGLQTKVQVNEPKSGDIPAV